MKAAHIVQGPARRLVQPGPVHPDRIESEAAPLRHLRFTLAAGQTLMDAIAGPLREAGFGAAALRLDGMVLGPTRFVMPTYSRSPEHVAYYSETHGREAPIRIERATATFGFRDGVPFLHCHALWQDADGRPMGGHLLAPDTRVHAATEVEAWGTASVTMLSRFDPETNFTLFGPERAAAGEGPLIVARIRPNEDLVEAIETIADRHGIEGAVVRSLVGSTVGARFEDGRRVDEIPTEILALSGALRGGKVDIEMALIDAGGNILRGRLARGANPVLICVELFLETSEAGDPAR